MVREAARERQVEAGRHVGAGQAYGNVPQASGTTRDIIGKAVGMSGEVRMAKFKIMYKPSAIRLRGKPKAGELIEADFFQDSYVWIDFMAADPGGGDSQTKLRVLADQVERVERVDG